jgi:hypothetical protein
LLLLIVKSNWRRDDMGKGEYNITLDNENKIVRVVAFGELDKKLGEEIITNARTTATEHKYNILYDVAQAIVLVSLIDWFFLPRTLPVLQNQEMRTIRAAVLIPAGDQERAYKFYETVTHNVGMDLRIFLKEDEAVKWLIESGNIKNAIS